MGISHWLYNFCIEKDLPQEVLDEMLRMGFSSKEELISVYHGSINDNKDNLDPGFYLSILSSYPSGWLKEREVEGNFAEEGGKIGDASWFTKIREDGHDRMLDDPLPDQLRILRYWDLAATEKKQAKDDPDEAVGTLLSKHKGPARDKPLFCLQDQKGGFWEGTKLLQAIAQVARVDGPFVEVVIEQEPGASGKITVGAVKDYFKTFPELQGHTVTGLDVKKVGDRVLAANLHWFSVAAEGRMYMCRGSWNKETLKQIDGFTQVLHDDRVTSITNGMFILNPYRQWSKTPFVAI
jgi:phage terminase large subunit-like protein